MKCPSCGHRLDDAVDDVVPLVHWIGRYGMTPRVDRGDEVTLHIGERVYKTVARQDGTIFGFSPSTGELTYRPAK